MAATYQRTLRLGAFELERIVGRGAMGEVWAATHVSGRRAAIKVPIQVDARGRVLETFQREARAMARLTHPGIVPILDIGEISPEVEAQTHGVMRAGSPFLAMEFCAQNLSDLPQPTPPAQVVHILRNILPALAHAHARGVLHLDIKPPNVLVSGAALKLADFGIAALDSPDARAGEFGTVAGTPTFMPPEQLRGRFRDYGPWTDLFAVGAMAWRLVTGEPPYSAPSLPGLFAKVSRGKVEMPPHVEVPEAFFAWMNTCLRPRISDRFDSAAQALAALSGLEAQPPLWGRAEAPVAKALAQSGELTAATLPAGGATSAPLTAVTHVPSADGYDATLVDPELTSHVAVAGDTGESTPGAEPDVTVAAGLGLLGLREPPLTGREAICERLWGLLTREGPVVAVVSGAPGSGRTRIAAWLAARAEESGVAWALRARGGRSSLLHALASRLRCFGIEHNVVVDRVQARLADAGCGAASRAAIAGLLAATVTEARVPVAGRIAQPALVAAAVASLARRERGLVVIDDAQDSDDAVPFAMHALDNDAPVMVLATAPDPGALQELLDDPRVVHLPIGDLAPDDAEALVAALVPAAPSLQTQVAQLTGGNPQFLVELLTHLNGTDQLEDSPEGRRLVAGATPVASLSEVRRSQLDRIAAPAGRGRLALFIAGALGRRVHRERYRAACAAAGELGAARIEALLARAGLTRPLYEGFEFASGSLRDTVLELADREGLLAPAHAACAAALQEASSADDRQDKAEHLRAAGRFREAADAYLNAATAWHLYGDNQRSLAAAQACDEANVAAGLGPSAKAALCALRSWGSLGNRERLIEALERARRIDPDDLEVRNEQTAQRYREASARYSDQLERDARGVHADASVRGTPDDQVRAARQLATVLSGRPGKQGEAIELLESAREIECSWRERTQAQRSLAMVLINAGQVEESIAVLTDVIEASRRRCDIRMLAGALYERAVRWFALGQPARTREDMEATIELRELIAPGFVHHLKLTAEMMAAVYEADIALAVTSLRAALDGLSPSSTSRQDRMSRITEFVIALAEGRPTPQPPVVDEPGYALLLELAVRAGRDGAHPETVAACVEAATEKAASIWEATGYPDKAKRVRSTGSSMGLGTSSGVINAPEPASHVDPD